VVVVAIRGEADPGIGATGAEVHWVDLGEVSRAIRVLKEARVPQAIMAGQVKHPKAYRVLRPDPGLLRVLKKLGGRNTSSLLDAVAGVLQEEGIILSDSTAFLTPLLATRGAMGRVKPNREQQDDIDFGVSVAQQMARLDIGQSVVVKGRAVVAVEAMEGTDETIRRAGEVARGELVVVKSARPAQDMRFDVPVVGPRTIEVMKAAGAVVLAVEAEKTLLIEREIMIDDADRAAIAVVGWESP
jgi:hypothetical protein